MKELNREEYKKILIEMLTYIDKICKENDIKYTLIGGTLIGAIRHKGMIPWDDDIDIGLINTEYDKLINILKKEKNDKYEVFDEDIDGYYYPYAKLISKNTIVEERNLRKISNYGVFIDIFKYNYTSNQKNKQKRHYRNIKIIGSFFGGYFNLNPKHGIIKRIRRKICEIIGIKKILKVYKKEVEKFNSQKTNYLICNWPQYGAEREILPSKCFDKFIMTEFEGINVMITKEYDFMLKKLFGNYMIPPPEDKRENHNLKIYWRE